MYSSISFIIYFLLLYSLYPFSLSFLYFLSYSFPSISSTIGLPNFYCSTSFNLHSSHYFIFLLFITSVYALVSSIHSTHLFFLFSTVYFIGSISIFIFFNTSSISLYSSYFSISASIISLSFLLLYVSLILSFSSNFSRIFNIISFPNISIVSSL